MAKSNILEKNAKNMQNIYQEYIKSGMKADEAAKKSKEEYIETLKSRLEFENTDYQLAITNRNKLEDELKNRGFFTILTSWKRTNNVIKDEIDVATKAAAGKKAISSITESLIDQLNKIDLTKGDTSSTKENKILTDKEKKALEKAAKERIRIRESLQQSELDLMDEGLDKELAKISLNYNKRIVAIKGNSKEEQATRENLAKAMQQALEDKQLSYGLDKEKKRIETQLDIAKKGSEEEYKLRLKLLDNEREQAINAAVKTVMMFFLLMKSIRIKDWI